MNVQRRLDREIELFHQGAVRTQVITPGIKELVESLPAVGWCLDVTAEYPLGLPPGKFLIEVLVFPQDIEKIRSDPRFQLFWPPDTIERNLNLVEVILRVQSGQVKPGDIFICYGTMQITIYAVNEDSVTFELDTGEETRIHAFPIFRCKDAQGQI